MKEELKKTYREFVSWIKYVREYKDNKDNDSIYEQNIVVKQKEIDKLKKNVENRDIISKEKDNLIQLLDKRIAALLKELSSVKKRNNELRETISKLYLQNQDLEKKLEKKEQLRRKTAGSNGGLIRHIKKLEEEVERQDRKIKLLVNNQKAPTKEEIMAYEMQMKEVEKRLKQK